MPRRFPSEGPMPRHLLNKTHAAVDPRPESFDGHAWDGRRSLCGRRDVIVTWDWAQVDCARCRTHPFANSDQVQWEAERQRVAALPDGPLCSMCHERAVTPEDDHVCPDCVAEWGGKGGAR